MDSPLLGQETTDRPAQCAKHRGLHGEVHLLHLLFQCSRKRCGMPLCQRQGRSDRSIAAQQVGRRGVCYRCQLYRCHHGAQWFCHHHTSAQEYRHSGRFPNRCRPGRGDAHTRNRAKRLSEISEIHRHVHQSVP